jgi:HPr kinase/phosphorylase
MLLHASCAARGADAVLFLGPPGAGKSDLLLRLMERGWHLVADDQLRLAAADGALSATAPAALAGMLEVRGLGIFIGLPVASPAPTLRLAVQCAVATKGATRGTIRAAGVDPVPRLPAPAGFERLGLRLPQVTLNALEASAPAKVALALDAALGRARQHCGAFAA